MSAVPGTRRQMRELADGTIRVQIDIDPPYRKAFLEAFSAIDMPVALAPLHPAVVASPPATYGTAPAAGEVHTWEVSSTGYSASLEDVNALRVDKFKPTGFPPGLTGLAVRWCLDADYQRWVAVTFPHEAEQSMLMAASGPEQHAKLITCLVCQITSRKELDTSVDAAMSFNTQIREPFSRYLQERDLDD